MSNKIKLGNLEVSQKVRPKIIAEISCNHCGNKSLFLKHIVAAKNYGADFVKIQTYEPDDMTIKSKNKKFLVKNGSFKGKFLWDIYKKSFTPYSWHKDAFKLAKKLNIVLFSSPFSNKAVDLLESFNVSFYKIASMELTDVKLVSKIASTKKPIVLSTGSSSLKEISKCINLIERFHKKIILLHCISDYPSKFEDSNLGYINLLHKKFPKYQIGLSDHTDDIYTSLSSIFYGATLIEKHFLLSNKINSLDKKFSITPNKLNALRKESEIFYKIKSSKLKLLNVKGKKFKRSIFAKENINKGERFVENNLVSLRPKIGIDSSEYFKIIGRIAKKNIEKGNPIYKRNLK